MPSLRGEGYFAYLRVDIVMSRWNFSPFTKVKQKVTSETDVELLQAELNKLYTWGKRNNMEFNGKKFQVIRYGKDSNLKEET